MSTTYRFIGDERVVFPGLTAPDGSTVECAPGDDVEIVEPVASPLLVHLDGSPTHGEPVAPVAPAPEAPSAPPEPPAEPASAPPAEPEPPQDQAVAASTPTPA